MSRRRAKISPTAHNPSYDDCSDPDPQHRETIAGEILLRVGRDVPLTAIRFGYVPSLPKNELYPGGQIGVSRQHSDTYKSPRTQYGQRDRVERPGIPTHLDVKD